MSRLKISSRRNFKFLYTLGSWMKFSFFVLTLCAYDSQAHGDVVPLIHNGEEARAGQWPWHATLFIRNGLCGGTFVDNITILTAAHCAVDGDSFRRENDIRVYGGRKYRDATTENMQEFNVAKLIVHPEYDQSTFANDIAILKLASDINITGFVRPVSLWNTDSDKNTIYRSHGTVIGFGLDEDDEESDTLQQATIPVLDKQTCLAFDNETYGNYLTTRMYCAGGKDNVSACNGDSGGGMFFNISDTWYLRGLVSFSPTRPNVNESLCDSSKPTVFTDVTKYRKWISRHTNTTKWMKNLKPCKDGRIEVDTECNAASRFDNGFLLCALTLYDSVSFRRISLRGDQASNGREIMTVDAMERVHSIDKDCAEGRFYWTLKNRQSIFSAKYDGTDRKAFIVKAIDPKHCTVDWISRRLYWVSHKTETIEVASLENPDLRTTLMTNVAGRGSIAVDPLQGKLYRIVGKRGIGWSNLDGSESELLLETSGINGITVSVATGELCYVKITTSKIECIDPRTRRIRTIVRKVIKTSTLAAADNAFYWFNIEHDTIESINQQGVRQELIISNETDIVRARLLSVTDLCPIFYSPCAVKNGGCAENTICLPNPRVQSGKICRSTISQLSGQTDPSTIIQSKPITPIRHGKVKLRKWPWHVAVYSLLIKNTGYLCGGSIVNVNTVLTAAHCFYYKSTEGYRVRREFELYVRVGSDYVDGITDATQVLNVAQILIHPDYNHSSFANDIAILKLSSDVNITNSVRPATIWNVESEQNQLVGLNGTVIGFSVDKVGEPSDNYYRFNLRETNLSVIDTQTCLQFQNATYGNRLTSHMFCASKSTSNNFCNGDDGGGMYFNINGTWYLRGIVSFTTMRSNGNPPACDGFNPTVFTDVTKHGKWLLRYTNTTMWLKGLEPCKDGAIGRDTECNAANLFDSGFLFALQSGSIFRVPMNGGPAFNISKGESVYSLDYDCVGGRVYWAEGSSIYSAKYDGSDTKIFITRGLKSSSFVSVDWISRRLYWFNKEKETIEAASLDNPDLRWTVNFNTRKTMAIAIDPLQGKLFRFRAPDVITSYNLDTSEPTIQVRLNSSKWYDDMKVSIATGELCYLARSTSASIIDCIDTRSNQIRNIISNLTLDTFSLAVTGEMIYWTELNNVIERISHHGVRQKPLTLNDNSRNIEFITAVTDLCPVFYSPCAINNGNCPPNTLCLLNPSVASGKICECTKNCTETLSNG